MKPTSIVTGDLGPAEYTRGIESVRHGDDLCRTIRIELSRGFDGQLRAEIVDARISCERDFLVELIVFVADEHRELAAASLKPAGRPG